MTTPPPYDEQHSIEEIIHELDALSSLDNGQFKDLLALKSMLIGSEENSSKKTIETQASDIDTTEVVENQPEDVDTPPFFLEELSLQQKSTDVDEVLDSLATEELVSENDSAFVDINETTDAEETEVVDKSLFSENIVNEDEIQDTEDVLKDSELTQEDQQNLQQLNALLFDNELELSQPSKPTKSHIEPNSQETSDDFQELGALLLGDELGELRNLLVNPETARLDHLEQRLDDLMNRSVEVAEVLPAAIGQSDYEEIAIALRGHVEDSLINSVQNNTEIFAEAIYPIIGPAIQKSILKTLKSMLQSLNYAIEQGMSFRGLLWRFQSIRSGVPFREIVLQNTLKYRVEQVFLIHRESGLLIQHVCLEEIEHQRDSDAVSAMLTAIQDFINDSFSNENEQQDLETVEIGDNTVYLTRSPFAMLACVVRGLPPLSVRDLFESALKEIHIRFSRKIETFDGDSSTLVETIPVLETCLLTELKEKPLFSKQLGAIAIVVLLSFAYWGYSSYLVHQRVQGYLKALQATEGIVILDSTYTGQHLSIEGLHDPLAKSPEEIAKKFNLTSDELTAHWESYQSLTPNIMLRRANQILLPPETITLSIENTTLYARGISDLAWLKKFNALGIFIPGIEKLDSSGLKERDVFLLTQVTKLLKPPKSVSLDVKDATLTLKGTAPLAWVQNIAEKIASIKGLKSYKNYLNKQEVLAFNELHTELENTTIDYRNAGQLVLNTLIPKLQQFAKLAQELKQSTEIKVLSFYQDDKNALSYQRQAKQLVKVLQQKIPEQYFISQSKKIEDEGLSEKLGFSIETAQPKAYQKNLQLTQQLLELLQPPENVFLEIENGVLTISGKSKALWQQEAEKKLDSFKDLKQYRYQDFAIQETQDLENLITQIEETEIYFENQDILTGQQEEVFEELKQKFIQLFKLSSLLKQKLFIDVLGHTDQTGSIKFNQKLAKKRALKVIKKLQQHGLDIATFHARMANITVSKEKSAELHKRKASFEIKTIAIADFKRDRLLEQQLFAVLKPPKSVHIHLKDALVTISGTANFAWFEAARKNITTIKDLKSYNFNLKITEEIRYAQLIDKIQTQEIAFKDQENLLESENQKLELLAQNLQQAFKLSKQLHKDLRLELFSYMLRKNSSYRKKAKHRAEMVIDKLQQLGVDKSVFKGIEYQITSLY